MALGLPSVNIVFKQEGTTAIQRGDRGIVALVLRDTKALGKHTVYDISDCPSELSEDNKRYILDALKGNTNAPLKIELFVLNAEEEISKALNHFEDTQFDYICSPVFTSEENEEVVEALNYFENTKFDYICSPYFTSKENTEVATWVKALRDNEGVMVKAVLANEKADHEGIINFTTDNIVTKNKTYSTVEFTPRIAGLIAGTSLMIATTYASLSDVLEVPYISKQDATEKVGQGELIIFKQSGQYRIARGVNSLVTTSDVKGEAFQKIKLVDIMDLMTNDIRQTCHRSYIGKYANSYDNKCILMTAIEGYLDQLVLDGLIERNTIKVEIDMEAQKAYLKSIGIDISEMREQEIKEYNTRDKVFIAIKCKILDAIEEINLRVFI